MIDTIHLQPRALSAFFFMYSVELDETLNMKSLYHLMRNQLCFVRPLCHKLFPAQFVLEVPFAMTVHFVAFVTVTLEIYSCPFLKGVYFTYFNKMVFLFIYFLLHLYKIMLITKRVLYKQKMVSQKRETKISVV